MGKTNFQTLKNLADSLSNQLNKLADGALNLSEIESLAEDAQELYERIVVIRYKSYESVNNTSNQIDKEPNFIEPEDAVEEKQEEELMTFDFSSDDEVAGDSEIAEPTKKDSNSDQEIDLEDEKKDASLNDNFKKTDGSVGDKFEKAPISDLKEHIGINRKFLYINELFQGNGTEYNATLEKLNSFNSGEEAMDEVDNLVNKNDWDLENKTVSGFIELVERRYLG